MLLLEIDAPNVDGGIDPGILDDGSVDGGDDLLPLAPIDELDEA